MIKIVNLKKIYKTQAEGVTAINNINFTIEDGEVVAFAGASGSGKTTLLNLIGTLDSISDGDIYFNGIGLKSMSEKEKTRFRRMNMGFIFQSYNLIPVLTAYENIELAFKALSREELEEIGNPDIHESVMQALSDVGLSDYHARRPGELSGGQQQRISIARAIVRKPSLILADEPTANLDSNNSKIVLELLSMLNKKYNITIIYSSHDAEVLRNVNRIITLKDGAIIGDKRC